MKFSEKAEGPHRVLINRILDNFRDLFSFFKFNKINPSSLYSALSLTLRTSSSSEVARVEQLGVQLSYCLSKVGACFLSCLGFRANTPLTV